MERIILAEIRLGELHEMSLVQWELAANLFITHHPGTVQLLRLDTRDGQITALPQGTRIDQFDALPEAHIRDLLEDISSGNRSAKATAVKLRDGKPGLLIAVPTLAAGKPAGLLVVISDLKTTLDATLSHHAGLGYSLALMQGSDKVYAIGGSNSAKRLEPDSHGASQECELGSARLAQPRHVG